ncbi:MAG: heavy metal translocating P-type ATPase [Campylobacterota bacterium]|nr:heavy metal translocating P-type ATPase [Campylobacterota bacterium]
MSKVKCDHCHLEFDDSVMIVDGDHYFCCKGCQGVYHLLSDEGLDNFYDKVGDTKLAPPTEQYEDSSNFDSPAFYDRFVTTNSEGFQEVSLIIEGIHCAACVWLNEKALHKMEGVVNVHINFTTNKAQITWADSVVKLSGIIDMIRAIGYNAFPYDPSLQEAHANKERKDYYLRMAVAGFSLMNMMSISFAQYHGYFSGIDEDIVTILNVGEWVLATPVLFYSGWVFFKGAYFGLKNRIVNMDILVATGAVLTYFYSIYITLLQLGEAYFDSVTMIIAFVLFGKFLEVLSKKSAADTLDVISKHVPNEVNVVDGETVKIVNVNEVNVGDIVMLQTGEKAALDGIVVEGDGTLDESSLTGESVPIFKQKGDTVISGTISIDAMLRYEVTKDFAHSTLSSLVAMLENSMSKKPRIEQLANRLSEYFSSIILLFSLVTFIVWWLWPHDFNTAFMVGISVIIIACPCALALATPVATLVGLGLGAKRGILFKEAAQLETMAKADTVVFDKTGTLTEGRPEVVDVHWLDERISKEAIYALAMSSTHPVSKGVALYLSGSVDQHLVLDEQNQIAARGIVGRYRGMMLVGGNRTFMQEHGVNCDIEVTKTAFYYAIDGVLKAVFELKDQPKSDAIQTIELLKKHGVNTVMLTGDHEQAASEIAGAVGIGDYKSELTPDAKEAYIVSRQNSGEKIVMVGDGVNDILALARADIGIAMGNGSDIAIDVSDVVLMNDSLISLGEAFKISYTTYGLIKQNLGLSLLYNAITIPLAMAGYIIPLVAAVSMSLSSLLVVGNSMRIRYSWNKQ